MCTIHPFIQSEENIMNIGKRYLLLALLCLAWGCSQSTAPERGSAPSDPVAAREKTADVQTDAGRERISVAPAVEKQESQRPAAPAEDRSRPGPLVLSPASPKMIGAEGYRFMPPPEMNTESYTPNRENGFISVGNDPLSTFAIDVDTASYSNIRRFIEQGSLPPAGAIRAEEMINYFDYRYPQPEKEPFSLTLESGTCPWQPQDRLVRIGLQAKDIAKQDLPPSNLVFLIDVSGTMSSPDKLPLLKTAMALLVDQLDGRDRVAIVAYAGWERVVLPPTAGDQKKVLLAAIDALESVGSTHASQGILTAYELARQTFMPGGNNRLILASDGDFNVGITDRGELEKLVEDQRRSGIYLTLLGFGEGNYHDDTMEILADRGNGNYAYIDSLLEAKKVLVKEMSGTLFTLAGDVKIQVEFNPARVAAYRLIGYENRALADEEFNDDGRDAGEIGAGHRVTALYEIVPAGTKAPVAVDSLKYQKKARVTAGGDELLTVNVRYKPLQERRSRVVERSLRAESGTQAESSSDFRFAAAVAAFAMKLDDSPFLNGYSYRDITDLARAARGEDRDGYRAEFVRLVEMSELLQR
jgi:Ca-activated chloride channel family protein